MHAVDITENVNHPSDGDIPVWLPGNKLIAPKCQFAKYLVIDAAYIDASFIAARE